MESSAEAPAESLGIILVVDDELDVRELVREILRSAGFSPLTAREGREALEIIEHLKGRVDLILTDVMMPVVDGPTLARRVARDWPNVPVLFMTGYPEETLILLGRLPREVPRIEKPFGVRDLVAKVKAALKPCPPKDGSN